MPEYELSVIGAGRVASQLAGALHTAGVQIRNIYSRNSEKANLLAGRLASFALSGEFIHSVRSRSTSYVLQMTRFLQCANTSMCLRGL